MNTIKLWLIFLSNTSWWYMSHFYNKSVDSWFKNAMEKYELEVYKQFSGRLYEVKIDGKIIWVENYPYASCLYSETITVFGQEVASGSFYGRPSRTTIYKFNEKVKELRKKEGLL